MQSQRSGFERSPRDLVNRSPYCYLFPSYCVVCVCLCDCCFMSVGCCLIGFFFFCGPTSGRKHVEVLLVITPSRQSRDRENEFTVEVC